MRHRVAHAMLHGATGDRDAQVADHLATIRIATTLVWLRADESTR